MANIIPHGKDQGTGRSVPFETGDFLVDPSGSVITKVIIVATYTVTANEANHVVDPGVAATGPFFLVVNGIIYSDLEGFFVVSGVDNRTWTWQDIAPTGQLTTTDRVLTWHY